jgi:hypothetical protein
MMDFKKMVSEITLENGDCTFEFELEHGSWASVGIGDSIRTDDAKFIYDALVWLEETFPAEDE